jgi:zinc D-Ala-D-Ala carboxypeptidase
LHARASNLPEPGTGQPDVRILPVLVPAVAVSAGIAVALALVPGSGADVAPTPVVAHVAPDPAPDPTAEVVVSDPPAEDVVRLTGRSLTDPASPWVVVNKTHPIRPLDFRPEISLVRGYQVASIAAADLTDLLAASDRAGLGFKIASAFRSYGYQEQVHEATAASRGRAVAERISARPGFSEHQTGLAVDLVTPADTSCSFDLCFADTPGGRWVAENSWRYGFIVRYRVGDQDVTGYQPEPWHLRYVGRRLAAELHRTGITTLEEYFGIAGGDYPAS